MSKMTAEQIVADAITAYWADEERSGPNRGPNAHDRECGIDAAKAIRAHGLLSEGAPSEEQIERAAEAMIDASPDVTRETVSDEEFAWYLRDARAALTASGAAPQKPQALAPEKVADVIHHAFPADSPYRCTHIINAPCVALATALCEAAKRGELT